MLDFRHWLYKKSDLIGSSYRHKRHQPKLIRTQDLPDNVIIFFFEGRKWNSLSTTDTYELWLVSNRYRCWKKKISFGFFFSLVKLEVEPPNCFNIDKESHIQILNLRPFTLRVLHLPLDKILIYLLKNIRRSTRIYM